MQIQNAKKEELALVIIGLRTIYVHDQEEVRLKLLEMFETALSAHYDLRVPELMVPELRTGEYDGRK